jgi:hypothetical protein
LPDSAREQNQLIELIFSDLPPLSVGKPKEEDDGKHYAPIGGGNTKSPDLIGADEKKGAGQTQQYGVPEFHR